MEQQIYNILVGLVPYKLVIHIAIMILLSIFIITLIVQLIIIVKEMIINRETSADRLVSAKYEELSEKEKVTVLRRAVCPDGVDPNPLSYMVIEDRGVEVYIASFTIDSMPKTTTFAKTFAVLQNFNGCTSSTFIEPISEGQMIRKLDKQVTILESEKIRANGDPNRTRKLSEQEQEAYNMAGSIERGEETYYNVGFLFSLHARSREELFKKCDAFRAIAKNKQMEIIGCYGLQAEAYLSNAPFNHRFKSITSAVGIDSGVVMHLMNKRALSTIYNYTQCDFSHRNGIPIGRNLSTNHPLFFDVYDNSHDGFTIIICGKTGSGKSTLIKCCILRYVLLGYRFVAIDSQARKGMNEGEYAQEAVLINGINVQISNRVDDKDGFTILNPFDINESRIGSREGLSNIYEVRTLELKDKINQVVNNLLTMIQDDKTEIDFKLFTYIKEILTDITKTMYADKGIIDGDADSIYEIGKTVNEDGGLTNGKVKKAMPTMTDFYTRLLLENYRNKDKEKIAAYGISIATLKQYVKELYYCETETDGIIFFSREEYLEQPLKDSGQSVHVYTVGNKYYDIIEIQGVRPYYDGQSTIAITRDCPFVNIDISQLTESEKIIARPIAIDYVNENFIKKNSEDLKSADKLCAIFDEAHEEFAFEYARKTIDNVVRTARKRNCSIFLCTQRFKEFANYEETQSMLGNRAAVFLFKQPFEDLNYIMNTLGVTEAQALKITNQGESLGGQGIANINSKEYQGKNDKNKNRGEVCLIDGHKVAFVKVDYLYDTEKYAVETDAKILNEMFEVTQISM